MAKNTSHLTKITDFSAPLYDLIFRPFWLGCKDVFKQKVIDLLDLVGIADGKIKEQI